MNGTHSAALDHPDDAGTAAGGFYRRFYNLRSNNGAGAVPEPPAMSRDGSRAPRKQQSFLPPRVFQNGIDDNKAGRPPKERVQSRGGGGAGPGSWPPRGPSVVSIPFRRLVLTLALAATLILSLALAGICVTVRLVQRHINDLSVTLDNTVSKMAEIKQNQGVLCAQLYDHVHRVRESLREELDQLVQQETWLRDNDKTGLVDFALESAGGRVITTDGTPRYEAEDTVLHFLGISLYHLPHSHPAAILQPDTSPGSCWAFRGHRGVVVVSLLGYVHLSAVSMEHIPSSQAPTGVTLSAPKEFAVLALPRPTLDDDGAVELGRFVYRADGRAVQIFRIPVRPSRSYRYVALRIDSNHGHPEFTCVYRFRVHGALDHHQARGRDEEMLLEHDAKTSDVVGSSV